MTTKKNRERYTDKKKYEAKQRKKKIIKKRREAQKISRNTRFFIRRKISPYYEQFRKFNHKHLMFIIKDTKNMERVLFQKNDLGNGYTLLTLPYIDEAMINQYLNDVPSNSPKNNTLASLKSDGLNDLVKYLFSVSSDEVIDKPEANITFFRNCNILGPNANLIALNVRPYDSNTWYSSETTTVHGTKVYKGNQIRTYFNIDGNLGKTCVFHDTITELCLYKAMQKKIGTQEFFIDNFLYTKKGLSSGSPNYFAIIPGTKEYKRFAKEDIEDEELSR